MEVQKWEHCIRTANIREAIKLAGGNLKARRKFGKPSALDTA
jgi:hypothetical protein